jgi:hypothetical protein
VAIPRTTTTMMMMMMMIIIIITIIIIVLLTQFGSVDQIETNEMGGACNT